jgi:hypothetical protein
MSSSPVAPISVAPVATTAALMRAEILGAAETELIALLGAAPNLEAATAHGSTTAPAPANPVAQAVDTARTAAAVEQASLAPLFADLTETLSAPNLPAPIRAAIAQVLAQQLPADGPIAPEDVRQAIARSGLFLEADLASPGRPPPPDLKAALLTLRQALPAPAPPPPAQAQTPPQAQPAAPPVQAAPPSPQAPAPVALPDSPAPPAAQAQTPEVLAAQASPAAPSAEPAQAAATAAPPSALAATPGQVPPPQAPAGGPTAPPAPRQAALPPGLPPAAGPPSVPPQAPAPLDAKAALLALQQAFPAPPARDAPAAPAPQDLKAALLNFQQAAREPATADTPPPAQRPAPPVREAALSPQAPAPATLPEHADLSTLIEHLAPQVEQALARLTLHQLASLPDGGSSAWMFEIPLATPQGTAMAQFEVERDGAGSTGVDAAQPWRARFSIDIEPLGPVHVHVAMSGGKAAVSVWAERADSLAWLRGQGAELASALPAEVVFRAGTPGGATPARGHFLDQTS